MDWIFSQAVMEHVDDLAETYLACFRWLRLGGVMTHQIDFRCHNTAREWNGHWARPDLTWRLIRGGRPFLLNREPYSRHRGLMRTAGFEMLGEQLVSLPAGISRAALAGPLSRHVRRRPRHVGRVRRGAQGGALRSAGSSVRGRTFRRRHKTPIARLVISTPRPCRLLPGLIS